MALNRHTLVIKNGDPEAIPITLGELADDISLQAISDGEPIGDEEAFGHAVQQVNLNNYRVVQGRNARSPAT